jgi:hypothetical protein
MGKNPHCACTICDVEKSVALELALPEAQQIYRQITAEVPLLVGFPTVFHLVASIHGCREAKEGAALSDLVLSELLSSPIASNDWEYLEKVLLLVFIPTAHAAVRRVSSRYQFLPREDISQLALVTLIQCLRSKTWRAQRSHFGFTLARKLRGTLFGSARRELEATPEFAAQRLRNGLSTSQTAEQSFERHAILRHFLSLCQRRAFLTPDEINLLIDLKLDETIDSRSSNHSNSRTSNSVRQKVKRLMGKLRQAARTSTTDTNNQGRFSNRKGNHAIANKSPLSAARRGIAKK